MPQGSYLKRTGNFPRRTGTCDQHTFLHQLRCRNLLARCRSKIQRRTSEIHMALPKRKMRPCYQSHSQSRCT